ncbi:hypothetical protein ACFYVR_14775 [Rhodococcus sp. NPDC003318]
MREEVVVSTTGAPVGEDSTGNDSARQTLLRAGLPEASRRGRTFEVAL